MRSPKVWKINGFEGTFTDEEIISLITRGEIKKDYELSTKDMKEWVKLEDSIYSYYIQEDKNETL